MIRRAGLPILAGVYLGACSGAGDEAAPDGDVDNNREIACALDGAEVFADACRVDRTVENSRLILTVRHPDGGFRRLEVVKDGRGIVAADGAEQATVALSDGMLDVSVGKDHYLLPATMKNPETQKTDAAQQ